MSTLGQGKGKRNYEFLKIYLTKNYSDANTRVAEVGKDKMKIVNAIRNIQEDRMNCSKRLSASFIMPSLK
ncbi:hypothetical protein [Pedobacter sp. UBA5917]|uniref:hypothetical protein n=1 Tax=Pedobacter sp. UBA5917 TaxID=1947061 RepID=UPI0039C8FA5D